MSLELLDPRSAVDPTDSLALVRHDKFTKSAKHGYSFRLSKHKLLTDAFECPSLYKEIYFPMEGSDFRANTITSSPIT